MFLLLPNELVQTDRARLETLGFHVVEDENSNFEQTYIKSVRDAFLGHRVVKKDGVYELSLRFDSRLVYSISVVLIGITFLLSSIASLAALSQLETPIAIVGVIGAALGFLFVMWMYPMRRKQIKKLLSTPN